MAKIQTTFVCQDCGYESSQWLGKCPECGQWNSFKEFKTQNSKQTSLKREGYEKVNITPKTFKEIDLKKTPRLSSQFKEMDNVLGGGIVMGSVVLIAGDPGIGKSTLLLQMAINISRGVIRGEKGSKGKVLYISGEESLEQIKMRASRIADADRLDSLLLLSLDNTDAIVDVVEEIKPDLVIIDSIQTLSSEQAGGLSGSVGQIRFSTSLFIKTAKTLKIPHILVGHVTKEGMVAGPMLLSHMVDVVLFLEGEKFTTTRILRSFKNRFGPVDEVGVFMMEEAGMREVSNTEQIFLSEKRTNAIGSILAIIMEGTRPFIIEIQALAVYSKLPMPRRVVTGFDSRRLELLLAVLQKHCRLPVETMDVFVNIAGGIKVTDPGVDLGVCLAVFSSLKNIALSEVVAVGEVGLLGEIRKVSGLDKRIREAKKLGFTKIITGGEFGKLKEVLGKFE